MSSVYKTLSISDLTVFPYKTSKAFSFDTTGEECTAYNIEVLEGLNLPVPVSGSVDYQATLNYRAVRHLYYSHELAGLQPPTPVSEQTYNQLKADQNINSTVNPVLIYDNYLQSTACSGTSEYENRNTFPTGSGYEVSIISIPKTLSGEQIQPGSFSVIDPVGDAFFNFYDDTNGNIRTLDQTVVGNIIYAHGIIVITNPDYVSKDGDKWSVNEFILGFNSETTVYQSQVRCHINENEFNMTTNPSAISGSYGALSSNVSGSSFQPYVTTIGLYNGANELIAVGKLAQPFPMPANTDVTFVVRWDC